MKRTIQKFAAVTALLFTAGAAQATTVDLKPGDTATADGWTISNTYSTFNWSLNPDLIGARPGRDDKLRFSPILPAFQPILVQEQFGELAWLPMPPTGIAPVQSVQADVVGSKLTIKQAQTQGGINFSWGPAPGRVDLPYFLSITNLRVDIGSKSIYGDVSQMMGEHTGVRLMDFNSRIPSPIFIEPPGLTEPVVPLHQIAMPGLINDLPLQLPYLPNLAFGESINLVPGGNLLLTDLVDLTLTPEGFALIGGMLGLSEQDRLHSLGSMSLMTSITAVPEPAVGWLMAVGLVAVGATTRRQG